MIVQRKTAASRLLHAGRWLFYALVVFVLNVPIIVTVVTSFKTTAQINTTPPVWLFAPTLENYREVLITGNTDFPHFIMNSIIIASGGTALAMILAFPAAYAIVRLNVGRTRLLPVVTNIRALPLIIYTIPIYLMFQFVGLLDTRSGLILISALVNVPVVLELFVGALQELPEELDSAARIDGASTLSVLWHVVLPLSRPILFAVAILSFIASWNEFVFGLILTTKQAVPVTVGATFFVTSYGVKWGATAAAMTLGVLPPLIIGLFAYPYIGRSMLGGAVKG